MSYNPPPRLSERPPHSRSQSTMSSINSSHESLRNFDNPSQAKFASTSHINDINSLNSSEKLVKWGVIWYPPVVMALYTIGGLSLAVGHHFYFASLHGTLAGSPDKQRWATGIGTAISFLVVALLRSASTAAYSQYVWVLVRRNSYRLGTLDNLFALTTDPSGFFGWEILKCAKVAMLVALICW